MQPSEYSEVIRRRGGMTADEAARLSTEIVKLRQQQAKLYVDIGLDFLKALAKMIGPR